MTAKVFHKMTSQDLVQLLLAQGIDSVRLQDTLEDVLTHLSTSTGVIKCEILAG